MEETLQVNSWNINELLPKILMYVSTSSMRNYYLDWTTMKLDQNLTQPNSYWIETFVKNEIAKGKTVDLQCKNFRNTCVLEWQVSAPSCTINLDDWISQSCPTPNPVCLPAWNSCPATVTDNCINWNCTFEEFCD